MTAKQIDLNCDMGESFGAWSMGDDAGVMPLISSANIACGFHAGDAPTMQRSVALAARHGVALGAHPSLPDLQGFGRREMALTPAEAYALVLYQAGALAAFARAAGTRLAHVKPHGALYNMAARDAVLADAIAAAVRDLDGQLCLVGLADSELTRAGERAGLRVLHEGFCDRRYEADGSLSPRGQAGAVIHALDDAVAQGLALARGMPIAGRDGSALRLRVDTLCIHGDKPDAAAFAQSLRTALEDAGWRVAAPAAGAA
jgi:UPF0271 protein